MSTEGRRRLWLLPVAGLLWAMILIAVISWTTGASYDGATMTYVFVDPPVAAAVQRAALGGLLGYVLLAGIAAHRRRWFVVVLFVVAIPLTWMVMVALTFFPSTTGLLPYSVVASDGHGTLFRGTSEAAKRTRATPRSAQAVLSLRPCGDAQVTASARENGLAGRGP